MNQTLYTLLIVTALAASTFACQSTGPEAGALRAAPVADPPSARGPAPATSPAIGDPTPQPNGPLGGPAAGASSADPEVIDRVAPLLGGFEYLPTRADFVRIADDEAVTEALIAIYGDASRHLHPRLQALGALRFFPSARTRGFLEQVLRSPATPDPHRRPAVKAYGTAVGEGAIGLLAELLEHEDVHTRDAAVRALAAIGTPEATELLQARLAAEPHEAVRITLRKVLAP